MSSFAVQVEELEGTVTMLHTLAGDVDDAKGQCPAYSTNSLGDVRIDRALDHFFAQGSEGLRTTRDNINGLAGALSKAAAAYVKVEARIAACAGGSAD